VQSKTANDLLEQAIDANNNKLNNDPCVQRLVFIVNEYNKIHKNKSSAYKFISSLKCYSMVQLLNDWVHFKSVYVDNKYLNQAFNADAIWDYFQLALNETEESEEIYTRNVKDKSILSEEAMRKNVFNGFSDARNVVAIQILDSIHCFFYHGESVPLNDRKQLQQKREWETRCGVGAQLENVGTMLANANDEDENKDPHKGYKLMKEKKKLLLFGEPFFYWDFFEGDILFCRAKYATLKQEILSNNVFNLSPLQYDDLLFLSRLWQQSILGQFCTAFNRGASSNEQYGIEAGLPLTAAHIMAVLLFTNYELLAYKYVNTGCNQLATDENYGQMKARNQEIGIWYRLLREVVMFYGETSTVQQQFFQSLDQHYLFNSCAPQINAPFVCTTSLSAAQVITSPEKGAVIEYRQHSSLENPYLDISYCSPFPHRDLKLFAYASVLEIRDIFVRDASQRNYVTALLLWERMINGQYYRQLLDRTGNSYQKCLMQMMDNELAADKNKQPATYYVPADYQPQAAQFDGEFENGVPKYLQALFSYMMRNTNTMWIIETEYEQLSQPLQNYLITLHDNQFKPFTILWNKRLRATLKQELAFKFASQFTWTLDEEEVAAFKQLDAGQGMQGPEISIKLSEHDDDAFLVIPTLLRQYDEKQTRAGFAITIKKFPQKYNRVLLEWNLHCPKARDFVMSTPSKVLYANDSDGYLTFNPQLVLENDDASPLEFHLCLKINQ